MTVALGLISLQPAPSMLSRRSNELYLSSKRKIDANESVGIDIEKNKEKNKMSLRVSPGVTKLLLGFSIAATLVIALSKHVSLSFSPQSPHQPSKLRFDWTNMPVTTDLAKRIVAHQTNCSIPLLQSELNQFGLGSSLHSYADNLCYVFENRRTWTQHSTREGPWIWRDTSVCGKEDQSPLQCYFPGAEMQCPNDPVNVKQQKPLERYDLCNKFRAEYSQKELFAATMEYLFRNVSKVVIEEAERQLNLVFPSGQVPQGLIVVHIRWGDKGFEMKKVPISEYLDGIRTILGRRGISDNSKEPVHVYLATEDQNAVREFKAAVPHNWNVYVEQYFQEMLPYRNMGDEKKWQNNNVNAERTKGKSGLIALASLLVAMEANNFVITTKSNWSLLMNELRENVVEPRCHGCTQMVDLRPFEFH
jgi:hypothetical protein